MRKKGAVRLSDRKKTREGGVVMKQEEPGCLRAAATFLGVAGAAVLALLALIWIMCRAAG